MFGGKLKQASHQFFNLFIKINITIYAASTVPKIDKYNSHLFHYVIEHLKAWDRVEGVLILVVTKLCGCFGSVGWVMGRASGL